MDRAGSGYRRRPSPSSAVGRLFHKALEHALRQSTSTDDAWSTAVAELLESETELADIANSSRLRRRFKRAVRQVQDLLSESPPLGPLAVETELCSADGFLFGTPDLAWRTQKGAVVVDYKTNNVEHEDEFIERYRRQLIFYARLVTSRENCALDRAVILSTRLGPIEVPIKNTELAKVAEEAREVVAAFNSRLQSQQPAFPSEENCRWCPYQAVCEEFWIAAEKNQVGEAGTVLLQGSTVGDLEQSGSGCVAVTVETGINGETVESVVTGIPTTVLQHASGIRRVRFSQLRRGRAADKSFFTWVGDRSQIALMPD